MLMKKLLDDLLSKETQQKLSNFSKKAKKELSSLPLLSLIGDATRGAAGLEKLQKQIKRNPNNPKYWLFLYEATIMYDKIYGSVSVGRAVINPVAFVASKGIATGLNAVDQDYQKVNPKHYLGMAISLCVEQIQQTGSYQAKIASLVILGKALSYSSEYATTNRKKFNMLNKSIQYMSKAIALEKDKKLQAEYFFYLANFYNQSHHERMYLRSLNIARKMGFKPAEKLLKESLLEKVNNPEERSKIEQLYVKHSFDGFIYTYERDLDTKLSDSWENVKKQQAKKIESTSKRVQNFMNKNF